MKTVEVEVYSDASNHWIVRTPGRRFPALIVQGDTFHSLLADVEALAANLSTILGPNAEPAEEAAAIADSLRERLADYERTITAAGFELPYAPRR